MCVVECVLSVCLCVRLSLSLSLCLGMGVAETTMGGVERNGAGFDGAVDHVQGGRAGAQTVAD